MMYRLHYLPKQQRGVVLVIVLILLLVMTLLGLASVRGTLMEERMGANQFDRSLAFQAAEAALREGEAWAAANKPMPGIAPPYYAGCVDGVCGRPDPTDEDDNERWNDSSVAWKTSTVQVGGLATSPKYLIELMDTGLPLDGECTTSIDMSPGASCTGSELRYRITARSEANGRAAVTLQSIYAVP